MVQVVTMTALRYISGAFQLPVTRTQTNSYLANSNLSTVFSSRRTVHSWQTTAGCSTHARAEATGKARSPSVERLVDGTTSMVESAERRRRRVSTVDVRCLVQVLSKVRRRCSMKTAVGQKNAQPECDLLRNSQPMEFTKQWGYA